MLSQNTEHSKELLHIKTAHFQCLIELTLSSGTLTLKSYMTDTLINTQHCG